MKLPSHFFRRLTNFLLGANLIFVLGAAWWAHVQDEQPQDSGTSTDLLVMMGSDFVRPGLASKTNYNIGIGHTFGLLKKDPIGDEVTFSYSYEDAGPVSGTRSSVPTLKAWGS